MRKLSFSAKEILALDRRAIDELGIPSVVLMDNAGRCVADETLKLLRGQKSPRVTVVCGTGNNGGDGLVTARYLNEAGIKTETYLTTEDSALKGDPLIFYKILKKLQYPVAIIDSEFKKFRNSLKASHVIVDCLFGIGLNRKIEEPFVRIIQEMNSARRLIVSVDVPSGLDATTGEILGIAVKADHTVTFSAMKTGFSVGQGPQWTGQIIVCSIGIPKEFLKKDHKHET